MLEKVEIAATNESYGVDSELPVDKHSFGQFDYLLLHGA